MAEGDTLTPEIIALGDEWEATFGGETMPWGFSIGHEQVPMLRECIRTRSKAPLCAFTRSLPKDHVY